MVRVAIPIFRSRVSPVFDSCTRVIVIDFEQNREIRRMEIYLNRLSLTERVAVLQKLCVKTVICSGISGVFHNMLKNANILLIFGIAEEVEQVVDAYKSGQLHNPRFYMPGYKGIDDWRLTIDDWLLTIDYWRLIIDYWRLIVDCSSLKTKINNR